MILRPATEADHGAIHGVVSAAFRQADEADLVDRLRADGDVLVELVAEEDGAVVGHVLYSRLTTDGTRRFAALAPVSVEPERQRDGIGSRLIEAGNDACRGLGLDAVIVLGHPTYYPKFGFSARAAESVVAPFSGPAFMALALKDGALDGLVGVEYARAFGVS